MDAEKFRIRPATREDEACLYRFICDLEDTALIREAFTPVFLANLEKEPVCYRIAEMGGQPVGMGSCVVQPVLHHAGLVAEIQELYVVPEYRSQGIGQELLQNLLQFARSRGALLVEVSSSKRRTGAHRFYEREGFSNNHFKLTKHWE